MMTRTAISVPQRLDTLIEGVVRFGRRQVHGAPAAVRSGVAGGVIAAVACGAMALAETGAEPRMVAEQIVVTGERRPARYLTEPSNTAVLDRETVQRVSADHPQELLNRAAGVFVHRGSGQEHLTAIRSPVLTGGAGAGSFLFLQDGVPLRAAGFANVNGLFEAPTEFASSVEVVRGPGSALYGSNAVHGVVNILTPSPQADGGALSASLSTLQRTKAQLRFDQEAPGGRVLAGVDLLNDNSWREPAGVDQQKFFARWDAAFGAWSAQTSAAFTNLNQETAGFAQGDEIYRDSAASRVNAFPQAYRDAQSARVQSRLARSLSEDTTLTITPFARWTQMEFLQHFLPSQSIEDNGHWSVGALATVYHQLSPSLDVTAGADLELTRGFLQEFQPLTPEELGTFPSFTQGVHYDYAVDAVVGALYGEAEWAFAPGWLVEAGLRAEAVRYDYDTEVTGDVGRFRRPEDRVDDFLTATPKIAILRELSANQTAYVRYARGARAPQTTDLYRVQTRQDAAAADVETIDSVEAGWRGVSGPLSFDLAAFWMEKDNFFFRDADGFNVVDGRTRHQGVEASLDWRLFEALTASGSATYARHTYRFDRVVASTANPTESITKGDDVDSAPRWLANGRLLWTPGAWEAELEAVYVGEYFMDAANTQTYLGHTVVNVRVVAPVTQAVSAFAILRNATNTDYAERADFAFGNERYFPGEDRNLTLGVRAAF